MDTRRILKIVGGVGLVIALALAVTAVTASTGQTCGTPFGGGVGAQSGDLLLECSKGLSDRRANVLMLGVPSILLLLGSKFLGSPGAGRVEVGAEPKRTRS